MYLPFDSMPGHSRLWIYQANRAFTPSEKEDLSKGLKNLCDEWSAHGTPLHTSFSIPFDHFVVLAVDEQQNGASGCSIDGSVRFLKNLQQEAGLDFFDRTRAAFLRTSLPVAAGATSPEVALHALPELRTLFQNGTLSAETITFNNMVTTKAAWENHWQIQVKDSWLARYLPKTEVAR